MKYEARRHEFQSGDLIAFNGKGRVSELIKWRTDSPYSHVGVIYRTHLNPGRDGGDTVLLAESTTMSEVPGYFTGRRHRGAQIVPLSARLRRCNGKAWHLPLHKRPEPEKMLLGRHKILEWIREEVPYDTIQAMGAGIDWWDFLFENEPDLSSLFCSELVARFYQICGLIEDDVNPSEQTPADVCGYEFLGAPVEIGL